MVVGDCNRETACSVQSTAIACGIEYMKNNQTMKQRIKTIPSY